MTRIILKRQQGWPARSGKGYAGRNDCPIRRAEAASCKAAPFGANALQTRMHVGPTFGGRDLKKDEKRWIWDKRNMLLRLVSIDLYALGKG